MKRIGFLLLAVFLSVILIGGLSCQSKSVIPDTSTPEGTIKLFLQAQTELDPEKLSRCFVKEDREKVKADAERGFSQVYSFTVEKVKIEVLTRTDTTARVKLTCDQIVSPVWSKGEYHDVYKNRVSEVDLVKQDGEWLITTSSKKPSPVSPPGPTPVIPSDEEKSEKSTSAPMPALEVKWEEIKLPPLESGYDGIDLISAEDADTISVYRMIGPAKGGEATLYGLWKTTDGGKTWNEIEKVIVDEEKAKELGFPPQSFTTEEKNWRDYHLEILKSVAGSLTVFGNTKSLLPWRVNKDPNNPNTVFALVEYSHSDGRKFVAGHSVWRLFLSIEGRWHQVNFPLSLLPYAAATYPETPLMVVRGVPAPRTIGILSTDDGSIKLFMTMPTVIPTIKEGIILEEAVILEKAVLWTANIKGPN
jgi:hypothetical protein